MLYPPPRKYRLCVADYEVLAASGAFGDRRTELIDGEVFVKPPHFRRRAFIRAELTHRFRYALEEQASLYYACSASILFGPHDMPQPDILLTNEPYGDGPVPAASIGLVIETADETIADYLDDRDKFYARAAIPEYWVVDVSGRMIHQLWQPEAGAYTQRHALAFDQPIVAITLPGLAIETTGL